LGDAKASIDKDIKIMARFGANHRYGTLAINRTILAQV
jgi:hypothetical protein